MLKIDRLFSDHVVLQREKEIRIWGTCSENLPEIPVTVALGGQTVRASVESRGKWTAVFAPMNTARELSLTVECGEERLTVNDVCIGEVWVAAGQSNMEFYMRYDQDCLSEKETCRNRDIRFFDVPEVCYEDQEREHDYSRMGYWRICTPEDLEYFSAAAYYFAKTLNSDLEIPVGIIGCNRGGSIAAAWMSPEELKEHGQVWLQEYSSITDTGQELDTFRRSPLADAGNPFADPVNEELLYGMPREKQLQIMSLMPKELQNPGPGFNNRPGCLYQWMLKQIVPCSVRGILWYQGESDAPYADAYKEIFRDLIRSWRKLWKENLPFCCVQLAPFEAWMACDGTAFPTIRQAQEEIADEEKNVYLISTSDVGMRYDIHPKKKKPVGWRLAICAEKHVYGLRRQADAPVGKRVRVQDGKLCIDFYMDGETLEIRNGPIHTLRVYDMTDGKQELEIRRENIYVKGKTLVIPLKNAENITTMKPRAEFAQTGYYEVNLYSDAGIPAMPFVCEIETAG